MHAPRLLGLSLALFTATSVHAANPLTDGALAVPANRIAGLYTTLADIGPCGSDVVFFQVRNTLQFSAGGSVIEAPRSPPGGLPGFSQRGYALGTWKFNPLNGRYTMRLRFEWFLDGAYDGYQTVERQILLSSDGKVAAGPVTTTLYAADGSVAAVLCGHAVSTRV
ncbi:hypothetical protein LVB87_03740 [Lysobacter sp. KIS68-7]|uniref:hypothetical protein n=1 Tax=Lysobacter sp. KIS68-7 TaxID=2904252 RepID=UPI001E574863|nr:hypothetical protein [Lysobacter sp. KIS68-7]UHQ20284.1 hypothetical protein LVB87_03740 [Lysobacter sp. KIS68-7]